MIHMAQIDTLDNAVAYAVRHGGWIAQCDNGAVYWFDAAVYTITPVMEFVAKLCHGPFKVGVRDLFDRVSATEATELARSAWKEVTE